MTQGDTTMLDSAERRLIDRTNSNLSNVSNDIEMASFEFNDNDERD